MKDQRFKVEENTGSSSFALTHPVDIVVGDRQRLAVSYEEAYRLCVELCAFLYVAGQLEGYQIRTKAGSQLNHEVTKDW